MLAVGIAVSGLLLWLSIRGVDLKLAWDHVRDADPVILAVGAALVNLSLIPMAVRWRYLGHRVSERVPRTRGFLGAILAGQAVNNVLPARAGDVVRIAWFTRAAGSRPAAATAAMLGDRALDVVALSAIITAGLLFVPRHGWVLAVGFGAMAVVVILAAVWVGCRRSVYLRSGGVRGASRRFPRVREQLTRFAVAFGEVLTGRRVLIGLAWTLLVWAVWVVGAELIARSLGIGIGLVEMLFVGGVLNAGLVIPSSPGFVGTYQWLLMAGVGLFGIASDPAFAFAVVLHISWYVPQTLIGFLVLPRIGTSFAGLRRAAVDPDNRGPGIGGEE